MQAEASENNDSAAAHEAGTDDVGQEDFDAAIAAMQSDVTEDEEKEEDISSVPEKSPPESADLETADPEVNASGPGSLQDDAEDDSAGADVDRATDEAIDTKNASESDDDPQEALDSSFVEKGEGASPEHNEAGSKATFADDNTFSDLDESDLEAAKPDRATEADELAALTTSFDDEKDFRGLDDEDAEPATARAGDKPTAEGSTQTDQTEVLTDDKTGSQGATAKKNTESRATDEAGRKSGGRKKYAGILVIAATILIGLGVIYGPDFYSAVTAGSKEIGPQTMVTEAEPSTAKPVTPPVVTTPEDPYLEKLQDVSRLRADLLAKKDEIDQLKEFYRDGISELEEELQQEATRQKVEKLAEALANRKIELDLRSIQRRWAYIDELEKPSHWLFQGSEELLFLSRRARIDLKMSEIASGIELTRHTRRLNASLQKYQLSPERLAIDLDSSRLRPLEDIWQAIGAENKIIAQRAVASGDRAIIEDICGGDTGRIAELSTLTIRASKCLAQIESSEFFLNRLTSMSPVAAKYLSNWNGQWLCLNGFRELPPEVARHLFSWDGDWISLNGLKDFPPQIGEMLLSWQGRQLELMGLVYHPDQIERIGLQQLSDWEKSGGKLFVPERIRTEISNLK